MQYYSLNKIFDQLFNFDEFFCRPFVLSDMNSLTDKEVQSALPTHPVSNLYLTEDGTSVFEFAIPGFSKKDVSVRIEDNRLMIKGTPEKPEDETGIVDNRKYIHRKVSKRSFENSYKIPNEYNVENTDVTLEDGLLTISIPLKEESKPVVKQLEIK